jgi:ribosomal-protein-alanine N-acetyltransferase
MARERPPAAPVVERLDPSEDLDAVLEIERASFANPWTREMFEHELGHAEVSHTFVIRTQEMPVAGFCVFWVVFDEIHVNNLAVRPEARRMGLGRILLKAALAEAAALGGRRATLEVRRSNLAAIRLYEAFGFRATGVRPAYYSNPAEDALVLWLDSVSAALSEG